MDHTNPIQRGTLNHSLNKEKSRLIYIDSLRIFLISLVVLHHLSITYGAPGGWYYNETEAGFPAIIPFSMFVATNQAFFMGLFFFISSYFILASLARKGLKQFIKDRLIRLGIPLLIFFFFLSPLTVFFHNRYIRGEDVSYFDYLANGRGFGFGPLWFVEALLIFTFIFLLIKTFFTKNLRINPLKFPPFYSILIFAVLIGFGQFITRIWLPIGWSIPYTNFQLSFFLQYIFLFAFGIIAFQNNWLDSIDAKNGWRWFIFSQILVLIGFPIFFYLGGAASGNIDDFMGGYNWKSFTYSIWEQLEGFSMIIGLLGISKKWFNRQGKITKSLSASSYSVFIIHAPAVVAISVLFSNWEQPPLIKFIALAPIVLLGCFGLAEILRRFPLLRNIL